MYKNLIPYTETIKNQTLNKFMEVQEEDKKWLKNLP